MLAVLFYSAHYINLMGKKMSVDILETLWLRLYDGSITKTNLEIQPMRI